MATGNGAGNPKFRRLILWFSAIVGTSKAIRDVPSMTTTADESAVGDQILIPYFGRRWDEIFDDLGGDRPGGAVWRLP